MITKGEAATASQYYMKSYELEKLRERREASGGGCAFYILSFLGLIVASLALAEATKDFFPSKYRDEVYNWIVSLGLLGLFYLDSERNTKRSRRLELRLWLKYDYPSLLEKASKGDPDEQYWLGMGVDRHGCAKECGPAIFWLLMAANQGHLKAQEYVAILYQNGEGVPKDPEKSAYWFSKAEGQKKQAG